ncbi:MAG: carboxymuconolactone decarboxylase family protein [Thalassobaculaceae bacterium]|nr:carboxymuconolactone decarboxylase family protein [Thalassobaculaceae bacterium]
MDIEAMRSDGAQILKEIIGETYFEKRAASTNDFNKDLRAFSEIYCFGDIWARPGLERKTRSLLCLSMLTALGKSAELGLHVRGALTNGCTVEEIKETLLQAAVYCGLPAAVDAYRVAEGVLREEGKIVD